MRDGREGTSRELRFGLGQARWRRSHCLRQFTALAAGALSLALALAATSCGGGDASNAPVSGGVDAAVTMSDFAFQPANLRVPVGATVTWVNRDSAPHNAIAVDSSWKTTALYLDDSDSVTFANAGEYDYYCTFHPWMKARVVVE